MSTQDLQLDWLRALVAVADAGTLSAAAPRVHRSQSAVSTQIQKLEQAAGRPLLSRGPRHLSFTPAGRELLGYARRLLDLHGEALAALKGPLLEGRLRLGVPDDYAARYLTPVLRRFGSQHAGVEIALECQQSTTLIPRVGRGEIDLALVSRDRADRGMLLFEEPLVWVGSAAHEAWRRDPLPLAAYEAGSLARKEALAALHAARRPYRIVHDTSSLAGQIAAVESGLAVAVLTRCSVPPGLQVLGERQGLPALGAMQVALMRSRASRASPAAEAMAQEVLRTLGRAA